MKFARAAKLDFEDKDKLNSKVQYTPDLNDGVVLTVARSTNSFPGGKRRNTGTNSSTASTSNYERSSISKLLREKGLL